MKRRTNRKDQSRKGVNRTRANSKQGSKTNGREKHELPPIIVGGGGSIVVFSDQQLEFANKQEGAYPFQYTYPDHSKKIDHAISRDKKGKDKGKADCSADGDIIIVFDR